MRRAVVLGVRYLTPLVPEGYQARGENVLDSGVGSRELTRRMAVLWWGR